ncbi:MAG: hypothetical protein AAFV53_06480, partial [Myxococcota bacterium]
LQEQMAQANGGSAAAEPFIPEVVSNPDRIFALLGDDVEFLYEIPNASDAHPDTEMYISGGFNGVDVVEYQSSPDELSLGGAAVGVGDTEAQAHFVHQIPGQQKTILWNAATSPVTVNPYTGRWTVKKRAADGKLHEGPDAVEQMAIGDTMILECLVDDIDPAAMHRHLFSTTGLQGFSLSEQAIEGRVYRVEFTANTLGTSPAAIFALAFGNPTPDQPQLMTHLSITVGLPRDEFLHRMAAAHRLADSQYTAFAAAAEAVGRAYGEAWQRHTDALNTAGARARLDQEILLNAAFAFTTGGIGGWVGSFMKPISDSSCLNDAIKDLAKYGSKKAHGPISKQMLSGGLAFSSRPEAPDKWASHMRQRVLKEKRMVLHLLNEWDKRVIEEDPTFSRDFDPFAVVQEAMVINGKSVAATADEILGMEPQFSEDFERGMWTQWLEAYGHTVQFSPMTNSYQEHENWTDEAIKARLKKLNLDPTPYVDVSDANAHEELKKKQSSMIQMPFIQAY